MRVRFIIEMETRDIDPEGNMESGDREDRLVDALIDYFATTDVLVLDQVEEGESSWFRSKRF